MANPIPARCREGHHTLTDGETVCKKCGKTPRSMIGSPPKNTDTPDVSANTDTPAPSVKTAAIQALKATTQPTEKPSETPSAQPDVDGIHVADLAVPLIISGEILLARRVAKALGRKLDEITEEDREQPTEALTKWLKIRFPTVRTSPIGEMILSQLVFILALQGKTSPLPSQKNPEPKAPAPTASRDSQPVTDIVARADSQSSQRLTVIPTPKEL
jgi:hypothetical protein